MNPVTWLMSTLLALLCTVFAVHAYVTTPAPLLVTLTTTNRRRAAVGC
jgi:hypothetical protein